MFVRPAAGRTVRRPDTYALLAEAGEEVPDTDFWHRRLRDGDVERADPADAGKPPAPEEAAPAKGAELSDAELQPAGAESHEAEPVPPKAEPQPVNAEQHDEGDRA